MLALLLLTTLGGGLCQWLPAPSLSPFSLNSLTNSLLSNPLFNQHRQALNKFYFAPNNFKRKNWYPTHPTGKKKIARESLPRKSKSTGAAWRMNGKPVIVQETGAETMFNQEISDLVIKATNSLFNDPSPTKLATEESRNMVNIKSGLLPRGKPVLSAADVPPMFIENVREPMVHQTVKEFLQPNIVDNKQITTVDDLSLTISKSSKKIPDGVIPQSMFASELVLPHTGRMNKDGQRLNRQSIESTRRYEYDSSEVIDKGVNDGQWAWDSQRNIFYQTKR